MVRASDWQSRLQSYFLAHRASKFNYGRFDCCLFAAGALEAMTGIDIAVDFRGSYKTRVGAMKLVRAMAGKASVCAITEVLTKRFEMPEIPAMKAQRGDLILRTRGRDYSVGILALDGRRVSVAAARGITNVDLDPLMRAWRV